jgi:hypothetical protein
MKKLVFSFNPRRRPRTMVGIFGSSIEWTDDEGQHVYVSPADAVDIVADHWFIAASPAAKIVLARAFLRANLSLVDADEHEEGVYVHANVDGHRVKMTYAELWALGDLGAAAVSLPACDILGIAALNSFVPSRPLDPEADDEDDEASF